MRNEDFTSLTLRYLDRVITREEMDTLNAELADNEQRLAEFRALCIRSQVMSEALGGRLAENVPAEDATVIVDESTRPLRLTFSRLAMAAAVALIATAAVFTLLRDDTHDVRDTQDTAGAPPIASVGIGAVAMVADSIHATWAEGVEPEMMTAGANVERGALRLKSGAVQLVLARGAVVTLIGQTDVDMTSDNRCTLRRGTLIAHVPDRATGFTVDVPGGSVVDLGTHFGVHVDEHGVAEVHVLSGRVQTMRRTPRGAVTTELGGDQAVRIDAAGVQTHATFDAARWAAPRRDGPIVSGQVVLLGQTPKSVQNGAFEHDSRIAMFMERRGVTLTQPIDVTITQPGEYTSFSGRSARIDAGATVTSYLLQYDPLGQDVERTLRAHGSITFNRPIVGVIAMTGQLNDTDGLLGSPNTLYRSAQRSNTSRYLEDETGDRLAISADRLTLTIRLQANNSHDHIRVLIAADPDTPEAN